MAKEEAQKVLLSVVGLMGIDDEVDADETKLVTEGSLYHEQDTSCLTYTETDFSDMSGTMTTVKVGQDKVSVIRMGNINYMMEFEEGKRNITMYTTPYGDFSMKIFTRGLNVFYDESLDPVQVQVDYDLDMGRFGSSVNNQLNIDVKHCH